MWEKESITKLNRIKDLEEDRSNMFRMDRNERTIPFEETFLNNIRLKLTSETLTNYPDEYPLYRKLSQYLGISEECLFLHTGSDLVIKSIFETFMSDGDGIQLHLPTYAMYNVYSEMFGAKVSTLRYGDNLILDIDKYCQMIEADHPKIVVMENPNGFIGNSYTHVQVERIIKTASDNNAIALVDEAYIDFVDSSVIDLIEKYDNLIIVRTFSKAWGIAGLRLGYAISNRNIIRSLSKVRPMHEFTGFTALVAWELLDNTQYCRRYIDMTRISREFFIEELHKMGFEVADSKANFVTAKLGDKLDLNSFREIAEHNGFLIRRPFREEFLSNWVRLGLLAKDDMVSFVDLIRKSVQTGG